MNTVFVLLRDEVNQELYFRIINTILSTDEVGMYWYGKLISKDILLIYHNHNTNHNLNPTATPNQPPSTPTQNSSTSFLPPSAFPISRVLSLSLLSSFLLPDGNMAAPDTLFRLLSPLSLIFLCDTTLLFGLCPALLPPQSNPNGSPGNSCRFCGLAAERAHCCAGDGLHFHFLHHGFLLFSGMVFRRSRHFSAVKIVCRQERLWEVLTNGAADNLPLSSLSGFAFLRSNKDIDTPVLGASFLTLNSTFEAS